MKLLLLAVLWLLMAVSAFAQTPSAQPPSAPREQSLADIERVCPNVSKDMPEESLLAAIAHCLDRLSSQGQPLATTSPLGASLAASGVGRLMVQEFHGQKVFYPDPSLTPGKLSTRDTNAVCNPDFRTKSVRHDTAAMKEKVYEAYGLNPHAAPCPCEVDHWLSLEDEGVDGSETPGNLTVNLWPQPYAEPFGARDKDRVETWMHKELCGGAITRQQVPELMAHWPESV